MIKRKNPVDARIIVEFSATNTVIYLTGPAGEVIDQEAFIHPFRLRRDEISEDAETAFGVVYDWINGCFHGFPPDSAREGGPRGK